jgi:phosphoglycolate phosphatase-like HAD superfamily hydrolase
MPQFDAEFWRVYTAEAARKPNPLMLRTAGATIYYGDSLEDSVAAVNAGIPFVAVPRFE